MIEPPKDAEGIVITFDTEYLYTHDGKKQGVLRFTYYKKQGRWEIENDSLIVDSTLLYFNKPDTPEHLIEDIERAQYSCNHDGTNTAACAYSGNSTCSGCSFYSGSGTCTGKMLKNIATRVERLCGDVK